MKTAMTIVTTMALCALSGCQLSGPRGGGMSQDETFRIAVPLLSSNIKQGELQTATISVQRGEFFKRAVQLEFKTSKGLSLDPASLDVRASDKPDIQLKITATKDAALGEYRIYVKGTPETGEPTTAEFKVQVVAP